MPARALGYRNPKGFAQGSRTAAGSLILTQFTADVMLRFLESILQFDTTKDTTYNKVDQLPPLNMSLLFSNEHGFASYQRLLGVRFVMDGAVYSVNDMYTERQITYVASDLCPLMPLTLSALYENFAQDPAAKADPTPSSTARAKRRTVLV